MHIRPFHIATVTRLLLAFLLLGNLAQALAEENAAPQSLPFSIPTPQGSISVQAIPVETVASPVVDNRPISRLNRLALNQASMYLPSRLLLGQDNRFLFKGKPASQVMLYISPKPEGFSLPSGLALNVGETNERLGGTIPENGVLALQLPLPDEANWVGRYLFVDAIIWSKPDYSDVQQFQMLDTSGRRTADNALVMGKVGAPSNAPMVMPAMPGVPNGALQQLTQMSEVMASSDERRRQLIDSGERNGETFLDRNSLINRPGLQSPVLK